MGTNEKKYNAILAYETSFAKTVATDVILGKPLTVWHFLIPFMFVFNFLRMRSETELLTRNFLFIKKLALDAAFEMGKGEDKSSRLNWIDNEIRDWLTSKELYSEEIHQGQMAEVNLLIGHYYKLLQAEGDSYQSLVKNAYETREQFEAFSQQLTLVEREIDQGVIRGLSTTGEAWDSMLTKQAVISEMRTREVRRLFLETRRD